MNSPLIRQHIRCASNRFTVTLFAAVLLLPGVSAVASEPDIEYGEYLTQDCMSCHSMTESRDRVPALGGLPAVYVKDVFARFRDGKLDNEAMAAVARSLSEEEIASIAAYLESLPAVTKK